MSGTPLITFPLLPFTDNRCSCGNDKCKNAGKHPAMKEWQKLPAPIPISPGAGYGIATGAVSGVFVLDIDTKGGRNGFDSLKELGDLPDTRMVRTPSGGVHLYFQMPDFPIGNSAGRLGKGLDVRGDRGFVVGPGSPHVKGGVYTLERDLPIAVAPTWLLDSLKKHAFTVVRPDTEKALPIPYDHPEFAARVQKLKGMAYQFPDCGAGVCQDLLWEIAGVASCDLELPTDVCISVCVEHFGLDLGEHAADAQRVFTKRRGSLQAQQWVNKHSKSGKVLGSGQEQGPSNKHAFSSTRLGQENKHAFSSTEQDPTEEKSMLFNDLSRFDLTEEQVPAEWLVGGVIEKDSITCFVAHPGSMKTWALYSLGLAVSNGVPWLGRFPTKQCGVLLVDFEMGKGRAARRLRILSGKGGECKSLWHISQGNLLDVEWWEKVDRFVTEQGIGLVLIDSLAAGSGGLQDENDARFATGLYMAAKVDAAFVFIHHAKKGDSKNSEVLRGTSALQAAVDSVYRFTEPEGSRVADLRCQMILAKAGENEQQERIPLVLSDARGLELDEPKGPQRVVPDAAQAIDEKVLLCLAEYGVEGCPGFRTLAVRVGQSEMMVRRSLERMLEQGKVRKEAGLTSGRQKVYMWYVI